MTITACLSSIGEFCSTVRRNPVHIAVVNTRVMTTRSSEEDDGDPTLKKPNTFVDTSAIGVATFD